jgi:O-antigen ligase
MYKAILEYYEYKKEEISSRFLTILGIGALFGYALFWLSSLPLSKAAETLLFIVSVFLLIRNTKNLVRLAREPVAILLLLWVCLLGANFFFDYEYYKNFMSLQLHEARHYVKWFLFVVVAWWLSGFPRIAFLVLFLACLGFLFGPLVSGYDFSKEIELFEAGRRITLGYWNWEHVSVYASFTLVCLVVFCRRIVGLWPNHKWLGIAIVALGSSYSLIVIYAANTRATFIGLGLAALVWGFYQLYMLSAGKLAIQKKQALLFILPLLLIVLIFSAMDFNPFSKFTKRIGREQDVIENLVAGEFDNIRMSSLGTRIYLWRFALKKLEENPLIGLGPRTREQILKQKHVNARIRNTGIGHFHNSYIELLLAYGIFGMLIFVAVVSYIVYGVVQARKRHLMPDDIFNFVLVFSVYWFSVNLVESYFIYTTGFYINALLGGVAFTFYLKAKRSARQETEIALDTLHDQDAKSFADVEKANRVDRM